MRRSPVEDAPADHLLAGRVDTETFHVKSASHKVRDHVPAFNGVMVALRRKRFVRQQQLGVTSVSCCSGGQRRAA